MSMLEILRSLLGPLTDLRHRITTLHRDVGRCRSACSSSRTCSSCSDRRSRCCWAKSTGPRRKCLAQRITVAILFPRLKKRLAESRQRVAESQAFLQKLEAARPKAVLSEKVYVLAAEYTAALDLASASVRRLEEEVAGWRLRGRDLLNANQTWLEEEREAVTVPEMVRQIPGDPGPGTGWPESVVSCGARKRRRAW